MKLQIEEIKPAKGKRHIIIPIDIQDGPERTKAPWIKAAKVGAFTSRLIKGAVQVLRPGVFLFVAAGKDSRNKYEVFGMLDKAKGHDNEELSMPVEVSLIGSVAAPSFAAGGGGGSAGSFQAHNVEVVFGQTSKSAGWRTMRKTKFDDNKSSFGNDLALKKIPPRDQLQVTKEQKETIWNNIEGCPTQFDWTNLEKPPEDKEAKRKWARKKHLNAFNVGYNVVSWDALGPINWTDRLKVCKAPVTYAIDLWSGSGHKSAASVSMPFHTRTIVSNSAHTEHCLKVSDLQMIREMGREGSFWWEKEAHEQVESAFPALFREDNGGVQPLISDSENEDSGNEGDATTP